MCLKNIVIDENINDILLIFQLHCNRVFKIKSILKYKNLKI